MILRGEIKGELTEHNRNLFVNNPEGVEGWALLFFIL